MELWIRNQDKTILQKVDNLLISDGKNDKGTFNIYSNDVKGLSLIQNIFGIYQTKERALEVLDEIQNALLNKWSNNVKYEEHYDNERPRILVYEMPKE